MNENKEKKCCGAEEALEALLFSGKCLACSSFGNGHINDTFLATFQQEENRKKQYILQRIDHTVFQNPAQLMENIQQVTAFLQKKIQAEQGDPKRETLTLISSKDGNVYHRDSMGNYWRGYHYIENTVSLEQPQSPTQFYECAVAFGKFQQRLSDYPAHTLHETIPHFHDTPMRFSALQEAVQRDPLGRVKDVQAELEFVMERASFTTLLTEQQKQGQLPLRVTHNDTKFNNIMIDRDTGKGVCVIDLDTVMPGLSVNDFGDAIRSGANTAEEDERDLSKVKLNMELYDAFVAGFLKGCGDSLTPTEYEMLPVGAKMMTLECGIRFLTDHILGDTYFKVHRKNHNLDRSRTQFRLVEEMENHWDAMQAAVKQYQYTR